MSTYVVTCTFCNTPNRIPVDKEGKRGRCGSCTKSCRRCTAIPMRLCGIVLSNKHLPLTAISESKVLTAFQRYHSDTAHLIIYYELSRTSANNHGFDWSCNHAYNSK